MAPAPSLIAQTEDLQQRRCLGILHGLVLCLGSLCRRDLYPGILLPPDLSHWPDLCPLITDSSDVSVRGSERCSGIFRNLCGGIFNGLYGPGLCLRIFLGRPSLELSKQGFMLTIFSLTLTGFKRGDNFVAGRRVLCGRHQ